MVHVRSTMQMRNAGALGGRATRTDDETIRPMWPMVSLDLPPPSCLTKRREDLGEVVGWLLHWGLPPLEIGGGSLLIQFV